MKRSALTGRVTWRGALLLIQGGACVDADIPSSAERRDAFVVSVANAGGPATGAGALPSYAELSVPFEREGVSILADLELGHHSVSSVEQLIRRAREAAPASAGARVAYFAEALRRTPFMFESALPIPRPGHIRVRLATLDCATYVYTVLALSKAQSFEDFVWNLAALRYHAPHRGLDSDPTNGNIYDFIDESLVQNAVRLGFLADVTAEVAGGDALVQVAGELLPFTRRLAMDPVERVVTPKGSSRQMRLDVLPKGAARALESGRLKSGDIVLFGKPPRPGTTRPGLIHHLVIASVRAGAVPGFLHASASFAWKPNATPSTPPSHSGVYVGDDPRREQLGVDFGGTHAGDDVAITIDGQLQHGYLQDQPRALTNYFVEICEYALVLRAQS